MDNKNNTKPGDIFRTFSHKTKINPGNKNDDILMKEIEEITEKISFDVVGEENGPFTRNIAGVKELREDETGVMDDSWIKSAKDEKNGFISISNIIDGKES